MEYCYLHNDLSEEPGDGCPLCESMVEHEAALSRWATTYKAMKCERNRLKAENALYFSEMVARGDRIDELETLVREMAGLLNFNLGFGRDTELNQLIILRAKAQAILNRPDVKAIMEEK